jgi:hypothetical protein
MRALPSSDAKRPFLHGGRRYFLEIEGCAILFTGPAGWAWFQRPVLNNSKLVLWRRLGRVKCERRVLRKS